MESKHYLENKNFPYMQTTYTEPSISKVDINIRYDLLYCV